MSELKVYVPQDGPYGLVPSEGGAPVEEETCYLKSDVDEVIRRHKYKICLKNAEMAFSKYYFYCTQYYANGAKRMWKWRQRWLELAKKFNPNNSTAQ